MHPVRLFSSFVAFLVWAIAIMPGVAAPDVSPPLYKLRSIIGHTVESQSGKDVGHIAEVVIEAATGDVAYGVVATGGFLGLGERWLAIPWAALQQPTEAAAFRLEMSEEQLHNAPSFDRDHWPDLEDKHWGDTIHAYYGQPPYGGQHLPPKTARDTMEQAEQRLLRSSAIMQREVMNTRGQRLGEIVEVVIDTAAGTVAYAVLSLDTVLGLGDKLFALPWRALQQSAGFGTFTLAVDKAALQEAPGFDKGRWPVRANPRWGAAEQ